MVLLVGPVSSLFKISISFLFSKLQVLLLHGLIHCLSLCFVVVLLLFEFLVEILRLLIILFLVLLSPILNVLLLPCLLVDPLALLQLLHSYSISIAYFVITFH